MYLSTVALSALRSTPGLEDEMRTQLPAIIGGSTGMPLKHPFDMQIRLKPASKLPCVNPYRVTPLEDAEMLWQIRPLQDDGWIRDLISPFATLILFMKKADGARQLYVYYRALNSVMSNDKYPIPHIDDLLNEVPGS
jgi:hypothetical protein